MADYDADRVVVELIADAQGFDGNVKKSTQTFDTSMNQIVSSASRAEQSFVKSSGNRSNAIAREAEAVRKAASIMGNSFTDVGAILAGPNSPFVAPVKQAPAVRNAMGLVQLGATALGGVLGGALVQGGMAAADMLVDLISKHLNLGNEVDDLVEKLKEEAENTRNAEQAQAVFANTLEGVEVAIDATAKALDKLDDSSKTAARRALEHALAEVERASKIRESTKAALEQAKANLLNAQAVQFGAGGGAGAQGAQSFFQRQIDELNAELKRADDAIKGAQSNVTEALSRRLVEIAKDSSDSLAQIKDKYEGRNGLIEQARKHATAEEVVNGTLIHRLKLLDEEQRKEEEAERKRQRDARSTRTDRSNYETGRNITEAEARRIVAGIGGTVTSGARSAEHNADVGGVPNSMHLTGQAVDIAKGAGITIAKIRDAFAKVGVRLTELLDEGDHFHAAWGHKARGPSADTLARRAQAQADTAERNEQAYQNEKASIQQEDLQLRQSMITNAEEIAKLELQAIEVSRAKYADNVESLVTQRKLTRDEADELLKLNEERAKLRAEVVKRREDERKFRLQEAQARANVDVQTAGLQNQADVLRSEEAVAKTRAERADIERRLLDLQFAEERIRLQAIIAYNERLKLNQQAQESERIEAEAAAQIAKMRLASLDQRQANAQQNQAKESASPLQSYFGDIQAQADDLNTAFEQIAAGGLANFTDKLTDAIVNFKSLGDVGRAVLAGITADLVKLAIRLILNATIGKLVAKMATAGAAAQGAGVAAAWEPAAAAVSLATFGANSGPAIAGMAAANAAAMGFAAAGGAAGFAMAEGGRVVGPGTSTSDDVPINASRDEFMIKARSARKLGYSTLEHINRTGELPSAFYGYAGGGRIRRPMPANDAAIAPGGAMGDFSQLRSIIGEAVNAGIAAMPDVNLIASLDPYDILDRALSTGPGQKRLIAALGENSTRVKATLQR